jgi:hypothetical protein
MSNGPENSPQPPLPEQQVSSQETETKSWVPKFVVNGIEKAMHSVRQARMDLANDELHDLDTSQTRHDKKVENAQYKDIPRATQNHNLKQIYDGLKEKPQTDGFVRAGARRKFEKNDRVLSRNVKKFDAIADRSKEKKAKRREKIEARKQKLQEKDPSIVDRSKIEVPAPNTVKSRNKARTEEVKDKLKSNLKAAQAISIRELLRTLPEGTESSEDTKIDEFTLRRSLRSLDGSAQALAAMTITTLQENDVIDSEGKLKKSRGELEELVAKLDPEETTADYRGNDIPETDSKSAETSHDVPPDYPEAPIPDQDTANTESRSEDNQAEAGNTEPDENNAPNDKKAGESLVQGELVPEQTTPRPEEKIYDVEIVEDTPEASEPQKDTEPEAKESDPDNIEFKSNTGIDVEILLSLSKEISHSVSDTVRATKQERNLGKDDKLPREDFESILNNAIEVNIKDWLVKTGLVSKEETVKLHSMFEHIKTDLDNFRKFSDRKHSKSKLASEQDDYRKGTGLYL